MFMDELDRIANRVSTGTKKSGYMFIAEDDYSDSSDADSVCDDHAESQNTPARGAE